MFSILNFTTFSNKFEFWKLERFVKLFVYTVYTIHEYNVYDVHQSMRREIKFMQEKRY